MSHEDAVVKIPKKFKSVGSTKNSKLTIIENSKEKNLWCSISPRNALYRQWKRNI